MKEKIAQLISNNVEGIEMSDIIASIEIPPRPDMGDFAFPCFRLAKVLRKAPNMIAADIKEAIGDVDFIEKIDVAGAYLNFYIKKDVFVKTMIEADRKSTRLNSSHSV